ncbi:HNH endonuclease [Bacillus phage vB_BcoS-136]|uniref:Putative NHN endonuclease n=1 Tax=Bacillus phage vB_BcoS-136 TaxID=2419619 RepID=A0A3G3BW38_9CAUD|nr:HNH endonuclease [Bacillus phage vB_BcoS-136]AYP68281.1 putative NHN endonuclease [Bacillus phage vB_BcoS-136]
MKNDIVVFDDYVEVILRDREGLETGRTIIDLEDLKKISKHTWSINIHGYARANKNNKYIGMHKLITNTDKNEIVDHKDRNRLNNRKSNLRIVSSSDNAINKNIQSNNSSGVSGVSYYKSRDRWVAEIKYEGVKKWIGSFSSKEKAIKARLTEEFNLFGDLSPQKHLFEEYGIGVDVCE